MIKNLCRAGIRTQGSWVRSTNATTVLSFAVILPRKCQLWPFASFICIGIAVVWMCQAVIIVFRSSVVFVSANKRMLAKSRTCRNICINNDYSWTKKLRMLNDEVRFQRSNRTTLNLIWANSMFIKLDFSQVPKLCIHFSAKLHHSKGGERYQQLKRSVKWKLQAQGRIQT